MYVLAQNGISSFDMIANEIQEVYDTDENGNIIKENVSYRIIGDTIGKSYLIGEYLIKEQAIMVFKDMLSAICSGKEFYDVRERENKLFKKK